MKYNVNNQEATLPLTVGSVEEFINKINKTYKDSNFRKPKLSKRVTLTVHSPHIQNVLSLYKDVLICIAGGATHARELAQAALKIEED